MVPGILIKSVRSIFSRQFIVVSVQSLIVSTIILVGFVLGVNYLLGGTNAVSSGYLDSVIDYIGSAGAVIIGWFLFPVLTPIVAGLFLNKVARIVEGIDYSGKLQPTPQPIIQEVLYVLRFVTKSLFLNIICLPLYLIPLVNIAVYYLLNSYLLGREFFEMAGGRYKNIEKVTMLRKANRLTVMSGGLIIALCSNIPFLNLLSPLLGVVLMMHLFYALSKA